MASSSTYNPTTVVSCPGKVLIAGGYLVLDPTYSGVVVATSSRFYTVIRQHSNSASKDPTAFKIAVRSPQFLEAVWDYDCRSTDGEWKISQSNTEIASANKFVQIALCESIRLVSALFPSQPLLKFQSDVELHVSIVGDNDFYSQTRTETNEAPPFNRLNVKLADVHKTGLGSSAAMVTSLVSALVFHLTLKSPPELQSLVHNLAQYVHSLAQGKVGSGFDVSSAVFGSQVYQRFNELCISKLLSAESRLRSSELLESLDPQSPNSPWTDPSTGGSVHHFHLPPLFTLVLADVDAGSHTPSMVGKVLAWRKAEPKQAEALWKDLDVENMSLVAILRRLSDLYEQDQQSYQDVLSVFAEHPSDEWETVKAGAQVHSGFSSSLKDYLIRFRRTLNNIRTRMRQMGLLSGVPIEPAEQSQILDASQKQCKGVVGGGVPGAGGYDAIYLIVITPSSEDTTIKPVEDLWISWKHMSVRPLSKGARVKGHTGQMGHDGLRLEDLRNLPDLAQTLEC